ncbi:hypothetical protein J6590_099133, partial [Homalodisca vitripennis]
MVAYSWAVSTLVCGVQIQEHFSAKVCKSTAQSFSLTKYRIDRNYVDQQIVLLSESQAALTDLNSTEFTSRL